MPLASVAKAWTVWVPALAVEVSQVTLVEALVEAVAAVEVALTAEAFWTTPSTAIVSAATPPASLADAERVTDPVAVEGALSETNGGVKSLLTCTVVEVEASTRLRLSSAWAETVWDPLISCRVGQFTVHELLAQLPSWTPSRLITRLFSLLTDAMAVTATVPEAGEGTESVIGDVVVVLEILVVLVLVVRCRTAASADEYEVTSKRPVRARLVRVASERRNMVDLLSAKTTMFPGSWSVPPFLR